MKGIILAGGAGTRLYPLTAVISKQLLPVYSKPMIYYPLTSLMLAGIRDILIISDPKELPRYRRLLKGGQQWGLQFHYTEQDRPRGLADAFLVGRDFVANESVCLILGDNLFYAHGFVHLLQKAAVLRDHATVFAYPVRDPENYGVVELDENHQPLSLEEKPAVPKSHFAVPGLYFYPSDVVSRAQTLEPSTRGELEITDLNRLYLSDGKLHVVMMGRGMAWLDAGSPDGLLKASSFVEAVETRQGTLIGSPEEVAYRMGFIDRGAFLQLVEECPRSHYRRCLEDVAADRELAPRGTTPA